MGYLAMLLEPSLSVINTEKSDDVIRHYLIFENYNLNKSFFYNITEYRDIVLPFIYFLGNLFHIKKEIIPFFSVFISYFFILKIFYELFKNKINNLNLSLLFLILFFAIDFRACSLGIRNFPAICVMIYGIFLYFNKDKKIKGFLFIIFANMMHISTFAITLVFILYLILYKKVLTQKIIFIFFIFSLFIAFIIPTDIIIKFLLYISNFFPNFIREEIITYTTGYWALEYLSDRSFKGLMYIYMEQFIKITIVIYIILFLKKKVTNQNLYYFLMFATSCIFILYQLPNLFGRFFNLAFLLSIVTYLAYIKETNKINLKLAFTILFGVFLFFLINSYSMRYFAENTLPKLLYPTLYNIGFDSIPYKNWL